MAIPVAPLAMDMAADTRMVRKLAPLSGHARAADWSIG